MSAARQIRLPLVLFVATAIATACSSQPRAPRATGASQNPSTAKKCKPVPVKADFKYESRLESGDRAFVKKVTKQAISYFHLVTPHCIKRGAVEVWFVPQAPRDVIARAMYGQIQVFTKSRGWTYLAEAERAAILFHEWYHVLQETLSSGPPPPTWFVEGTAEWAGFDAAVHFGYFDSLDYVRRAIRYDAGRPPRSLTEAKPENPGVYSLYFTGIDFLTSHYGGRDRLRRFWVRYDPGESWKAVFRSVFGVPVKTFLKKYEAYREAGFSA